MMFLPFINTSYVHLYTTCFCWLLKIMQDFNESKDLQKTNAMKRLDCQHRCRRIFCRQSASGVATRVKGKLPSPDLVCCINQADVGTKRGKQETRFELASKEQRVNRFEEFFEMVLRRIPVSIFFPCHTKSCESSLFFQPSGKDIYGQQSMNSPTLAPVELSVEANETVSILQGWIICLSKAV